MADSSERSTEPRTAEHTKQSASPTRVVLVRHAVTSETGPMLTGRAPRVDLSDKGVGQAEAVASRLSVLPIAAVYASPIERTLQTAQHVARAHDLDVQTHAGLLEADYGKWTKQPIAELAKTDEWKVVQVAPSRAKFPGGETIRSMQSRIVSAIDELVGAHACATIAVVSHADPIKSAVAHYAGIHLDLFQRIHVSPASVTVLDFHTFGVVLAKLNDTGSLDEFVSEDRVEESADG